MAGYEDTRQKIISTLMGRPNGTEIQPENHQDYALNMLDYIRSLELIATSTLIGVAESNTTPVQPNSSRVCYIAGVAQNQNVVFENFIDENGNPIYVTTGDMEGVFIILLWNTQYWSAQTFSTNIISHSESATFYYRYNIRKTYASIALMNADVESPIGTDGKYIKVGDIVTVVNSTTPSENGIYSYEGATDGWKYQSSFNFQVEQVRSQDTNTSPSSKLFDDELTQVRSDLNETNTNIESVKGGNLDDSVIGLPKLTPEAIAYIGSSGTVTNLADGEDLENVIINDVEVIREKTTKPYDAPSYSGLGRVILRKNMVNGVNVLTQEMINQANTIYEVRYDFTLNEDITIPANCILKFDGGSIIGEHTITGTNTGIDAGLIKIFNTGVTLAGTFKNGEWNIEWFGADYSALNNDIIINFAIEQIYNIGGGTLKLNHDITISDTVWLMSGVSLLGTSLNTKTDTWWPNGGTNIRCCFANKNKWAISVKAKNNVIIPYNVLDITDYDTYPLDGIRIENLVIVLVKDDGTDPKTYELEPIFGGIRLKNFTGASLKQVDIFGFKYGIAISFSWGSSINAVHSYGKSVGLYLGPTITTLTFNSCTFSMFGEHHILGNQDVDFQLFNATVELVPSYIEQTDIKSIGIVIDRRNNSHAACCTFVGCAIEGYNIAASIASGRHNFVSLYIENINKTVIWARASSINILGETYSLFRCIPIIEDGYEFGGIYSSFNIANFPTSRCYNGERCFYTVNGNDFPSEISFYDRYYTDENSNLVFEKNPNKKVVGIPNVLSVVRDSSSPSIENVVTPITAIGSGMVSIVMSEISKRAKEIDADTIIINLTQDLYMTPPSEPIENKNVFIKATFNNIDTLHISSIPFKNSNIVVKDDAYIDTSTVTFNIFGKCNINLYAWIIQTHLINLSGNEPIELNITFRNSDLLPYATRDRIINNPSFECPYMVRIFNSDGTLYTTFTNPSKPTKSVPVGYVYIENGVPIYYTGDTSGGKSGWVNATGIAV